MTTLVLPDTTVVRNFAILHRMDLLEGLVRGRAAWCGTVATECDAQARLPELGDMTLAHDIFGAPWMPEDAEHIDVALLRERLAAPGDDQHAHLGEAETIVLASRRSPGAVFVTDDRSALELAFEYSLKAVTTTELLRLAVRTGRLDPSGGWGYVRTLRAYQRYVPTEVGRTRAEYENWLTR